MNKNRENQMAENTNPAQTVAADFVAQFTDEDLLIISQKQPAELKQFIQDVAAANLEYAISILPGRPSRPSKPTV